MTVPARWRPAGIVLQLTTTLVHAGYDVIVEGMLREATHQHMFAGVRQIPGARVLDVVLSLPEGDAWLRHSQRHWSSAVTREDFHEWVCG